MRLDFLIVYCTIENAKSRTANKQGGSVAISLAQIQLVCGVGDWRYPMVELVGICATFYAAINLQITVKNAKL